MFRPVVIGVNHIVWAYSNLAFLRVNISLESIAYVNGNGAAVSTAGSKATAITDSRSAGSIGVTTATGFIEGLNVISHVAAVTVAAHAEGRTSHTTVGVASVEAIHSSSSTAGGIPEV